MLIYTDKVNIEICIKQILLYICTFVDDFKYIKQVGKISIVLSSQERCKLNKLDKHI